MPKPTQTTGNKTCTKCGVTKDIAEFYKRGGKQSPNTRHNHCKECTKTRVTKRYNDDPNLYKEQHLKRSYGITLNDYDQMLTEQNHQCAICGTTEPGEGMELSTLTTVTVQAKSGVFYASLATLH